jgi:hypothetical protein
MLFHVFATSCKLPPNVHRALLESSPFVRVGDQGFGCSAVACVLL